MSFKKSTKNIKSNISKKFQYQLSVEKGNVKIKKPRELTASDINKSSKKQLLQELRSKLYFHGSPRITEKDVKDILQNGLKPLESEEEAHDLTPIEDRTYVTPDMRYGLTNMIGSMYVNEREMKQAIKKDGKHGYLFVVDGKNFPDDIIPDEDDMGDILHNYYRDYPNHSRELPKGLEWIRSHVQSYEDEIIDEGDEYLVKELDQPTQSTIAREGKNLLLSFSPEELYKIALILNSSVSVDGRIPVKECWIFDKEKLALLNYNMHVLQNNFFKIAERCDI